VKPKSLILKISIDLTFEFSDKIRRISLGEMKFKLSSEDSSRKLGVN
jgi:hypothetical protein